MANLTAAEIYIFILWFLTVQFLKIVWTVYILFLIYILIYYVNNYCIEINFVQRKIIKNAQTSAHSYCNDRNGPQGKDFIIFQYYQIPYEIISHQENRPPTVVPDISRIYPVTKSGTSTSTSTGTSTGTSTSSSTSTSTSVSYSGKKGIGSMKL